MTRRMQHYDVAAWQPWLLVAAFGAALILTGIVLQIAQLAVSIRQRESAARRDRRPVERPLAGMVDPLAAAGLQLRGAAPRRGRGGLLGHQGAGPPAGAPGRGAGIRGHRDAAQQRDRLHLRLLRHRHGLRPDLAHLVAGRPSASSAPTPPSSSSPGATGSRTSSRPRRSRASTAPTAARRSAALAAGQGASDEQREGTRRSQPHRRAACATASRGPSMPRATSPPSGSSSATASGSS